MAPKALANTNAQTPRDSYMLPHTLHQEYYRRKEQYVHAVTYRPTPTALAHMPHDLKLSTRVPLWTLKLHVNVEWNPAICRYLLGVRTESWVCRRSRDVFWLKLTGRHVLSSCSTGEGTTIRENSAWSSI